MIAVMQAIAMASRGNPVAVVAGKEGGWKVEFWWFLIERWSEL